MAVSGLPPASFLSLWLVDTDFANTSFSPAVQENRWYHNRTVRRAKAGQLSEEIMREYLHNPAEQKHEYGSAAPDPMRAGVGEDE